MARSSSYDPKRHPKLALSFARKGKTNYEIAAKFGITRETLKEWRKKYPELSDALSRGRDIAVADLEESMFNLAKGFEIEEKKVIAIPEKDDFGNEILRPIRIEKTKRYIPPREGAAKLLLNAWAPEVYKDSIEHTGKGGGPIKTEEVSHDKLREIAEDIIRLSKK